MEKTKAADYSSMTWQEEYQILKRIVRFMDTDSLLSIGDVYSGLKEELNNEILDAWAEEFPERAYPGMNNDDDEDEEEE